MSQELDSPRTERSTALLFYRAIVVGLLVVVAALSAALSQQLNERDAEAARRAHAGASAAIAQASPSQPVAPPVTQPAPPAQLRLVDLAAHLAKIEQQQPELIDLSETYFANADGTVHMHVIGRGQMCPLHIHRVTHEATLVVSGTPEVRQVYSLDYHRSSSVTAKQRPGKLVYSPPFCAHRWSNQDATHVQANLVFASPPFDGNLYIDDGDKRSLAGGQPSDYTIDQWLDDCPASEAACFRTLPIMQGKLSVWVVRGKASLPSTPGPRVLVLTRGRMQLSSHGALPLHAMHLAVLSGDQALEVSASEPSVALVFAPGNAPP